MLQYEELYGIRNKVFEVTKITEILILQMQIGIAT